MEKIKNTFLGALVDIETRRQKQQELMVRMVERKVRERAQQLYEERGLVDGQALGDWVQAESEVLENSIVAPLYKRFRSNAEAEPNDESGEFASQDSEPFPTSA